MSPLIYVGAGLLLLSAGGKKEELSTLESKRNKGFKWDQGEGEIPESELPSSLQSAVDGVKWLYVNGRNLKKEINNYEYQVSLTLGMLSQYGALAYWESFNTAINLFYGTADKIVPEEWIKEHPKDFE